MKNYRAYSLTLPLALSLAAPQVMASTVDDAQGLSITVQEVAELSLHHGPSGTHFDIGANATQAGDIPSAVVTGAMDARLHYTSVVPAGTSRSISVSMDGDLQPGMQLMLSIPSIIGDGQVGNSQLSAATELTASPRVAISDIGSATTGTGSHAGAQLNYSLNYDVTKLTATDSPIDVTVLYTLSAAE